MIDVRHIADVGAEVTPQCAHFGSCGGCQLQQLSQATQLAQKQAAIAAMFAEAGLLDLPAMQAHAAAPWQYRNRIRLRVERVEEELRFGYSRRGSHAFLPINGCPIAAEPLWAVAETLQSLAATQAAVSALLEASAELEIFANDDLSRVQLTFFARHKQARAQPQFAAAIAALQAAAAVAIAGAALVYADPQSGRIVRTLSEHGSAGVTYRVGEETYWISRGGFFQVNRFLLPTLVELVTREAGAARRGELAWDLFAGVGLFTRVLARSFARVVAVEANPVATQDLRGALAKISPASEAIAATTTEFLRRAVVDRERPELVVLDPPRAGAGVEACSLLARLAPQQIVYVSCDPVTLVRDLSVLAEEYAVKALHLVDLFPQTLHVETVAVLERRTQRA